MAYKTILLSLNDVERADAMLDAGITIAASQDAHLIGFYVIPAAIVYPEVGFSTVAGVFDGHQVYFKTHLAAVKDLFDKRTSKAGVRAEWRSVESTLSTIAPALIEHALSADLVIVSQIPSGDTHDIEGDLVERVVMECGRPVLMIPQKGAYKTPASAVVGYNATRESARAMFEAMPLLRGLKDVRVVWVDPRSGRGLAGDVPGAEAATALARHGIVASAEGLAAGGHDAGDALLRRAHDLGAGLVVMGAYAHSRLREYIFGGATSHVLDNADLPVLMAH